jgi:hypothetical protein
VFIRVGSDVTTDARGFLNVELSLVEALWMTKVLRKAGLQARPIPKQYRGPAISQDAAERVAQDYVSRMRTERPELGLAEVHEVPLPWPIATLAYGFISKSEKLQSEGIVPPGLTICVDRISGMLMDDRALLESELMQMLIE